MDLKLFKFCHYPPEGTVKIYIYIYVIFPVGLPKIITSLKLFALTSNHKTEKL